MGQPAMRAGPFCVWKVPGSVRCAAPQSTPISDCPLVDNMWELHAFQSATPRAGAQPTEEREQDDSTREKRIDPQSLSTKCNRRPGRHASG